MEKAEGLTLADLPPGTQAKVLNLAAEGALRRRLLDLGLVPGTVVTAIGKSPAGDPAAYRIRGAVMALRAEVAGLIKAVPFPDADLNELQQEVRQRHAKS
jgi:ferrous iron transport protein A